MDSHKYFGLSYKVIWQESIDSCTIPLGESKWIFSLGVEFLTLLLNIIFHIFQYTDINCYKGNGKKNIALSWSKKTYPKQSSRALGDFKDHQGPMVVTKPWITSSQYFVYIWNLRGYGTSYQNLACFVLYLKIINNFLKDKLRIL